MSFLSRFEAILFDLNGTLAEDFDRFDPGQDYHATYTRLGGRGYGPDDVHRIIGDSLARCLHRYDQGPWDPFPPYAEFLPPAPARETVLMEDTVAEHELGVIPTPRLAWLKRLSATHRLGLVSDVWAPSRRLRVYLRATGLDRMMDVTVLSSELGAVKPSPMLFRAALAGIQAPADTVLFVGDDYCRDIEGAAACGLSTVWISASGKVPGDVRPDRIATNVESLADLD